MLQQQMTITPTNKPTNNGPSVGNIPAEVGTFLLAANDPAIASTGTT